MKSADNNVIARKEASAEMERGPGGGVHEEERKNIVRRRQRTAAAVKIFTTKEEWVDTMRRTGLECLMTTTALLLR